MPILLFAGQIAGNVLSSNFRWWQGQWQKCSKSCGKGISIRSVLCVRSSGNDEQVALKDEACAVITEKPPVFRSCFKRACPLAWTVGSWSKVKAIYATCIEIFDVKLWSRSSARGPNFVLLRLDLFQISNIPSRRFFFFDRLVLAQCCCSIQRHCNPTIIVT